MWDIYENIIAFIINFSACYFVGLISSLLFLAPCDNITLIDPGLNIIALLIAIPVYLYNKKTNQFIL